MAPPQKKNLATVVHEWTHEKDSYRLIATAKYTPGYRDGYVVEKLGANTLGEPNWSVEFRWLPTQANELGSPYIAILFSAIESVKLEHEIKQRELLNLPRSFVRQNSNPESGQAYETCLHCTKHISRHYGDGEYRCDPKAQPTCDDDGLTF